MVSEEELERREAERESLYQNLAQLQEAHGLIFVPTETNSSEFSVETYSVQKTFDNVTLKELTPFADKVVAANFSNTQLTDDALATLEKFENLRVLDLSKTKIEGQQIAKLASLKDLESLNLYGTPLSAERVHDLAQLTQLKNLYTCSRPIFTTTPFWPSSRKRCLTVILC